LACFLLAALLAGPVHGYAIIKRAEEIKITFG